MTLFILPISYISVLVDVITEEDIISNSVYVAVDREQYAKNIKICRDQNEIRSSGDNLLTHFLSVTAHYSLMDSFYWFVRRSIAQPGL
jgi:hypothetical protein